MEERAWKIELADGTVLRGTKMNGNNFIGEGITREIFQGNLLRVTIIIDEVESEYSNMELVQLQDIDGEQWFILRQIPDEQMATLKLRSDVDYIAAMTDVDLEEV